MPTAEALRVLRSSVEDFLYEEAALLDAWRLNEWAELFTEDAVSLVPTADSLPEDPNNSLFLVADDMPKLRARVRHLLGETAWVENPRSQTTRMISNVRVTEVDEQVVRVTANFMVHRHRRGRSDTFIGRYEYTLLPHGNRFKIVERKVLLNQDSLRPQNKISIII